MTDDLANTVSTPEVRPIRTPADAPKHPAWDHAKWPYGPRDGIQSEGNYKYITKGLFLETCDGDHKHVRYCLDDHDLYVPEMGKWIPSARLIYIHALDEYDAARKLVGNLTHWERLFVLAKFEALIEEWRIEQAHIQRLALRELLTSTAKSGQQGSVTAIRTLLQMIDKQPVGRPKKEKPQPKALPEEGADHLRVVAAHGERVK